MGSCHPLRFAASLVAYDLEPASNAAREAGLQKELPSLRTPELKDWS
jgi:hypothetical protein